MTSPPGLQQLGLRLPEAPHVDLEGVLDAKAHRLAGQFLAVEVPLLKEPTKGMQ